MTDQQLTTQPHDEQAERQVLGAMLATPKAVPEGMELGDADFYVPANRLIFGLLAELFTEGKKTDIVSVNAELQSRGLIGKMGGAPYLHQLQSELISPAGIRHYIGIVRDRSVLRSVITAGTQATQWGFRPDGDSAEEIAERAATLMGRVRDRGQAEDDAKVMTIEELLARPIEYDWLVPGLIERLDRLIITGQEGEGKSTLLRQLAVTLAAGVHPFRHHRIDPCKVLVIDCESGVALSQRKYRPLINAANKAGAPIPAGNLRIEVRPDGLDLAGHTDMRWLMRRIEKYMPDLLVIGPIYRLHQGDPNDERAARAISVALDKARVTANCALITETHAPHSATPSGHRTLRPFGSSLWRRWPEFGYGLQFDQNESDRSLRLMDFVPWRGARDEREWPKQIVGDSTWYWKEFDSWSPSSALRRAA